MKAAALFTALVFLIIGCATHSTRYNKDMAGSLAVYGNWCGPGHPKYQGREGPEPIDAIDAACKRHDICYVEQRYLNCACDSELVRELKQLRYTDQSSPAADGILAYFTASVCRGQDGFPGITEMTMKAGSGAIELVPGLKYVLFSPLGMAVAGDTLGMAMIADAGIRITSMVVQSLFLKPFFGIEILPSSRPSKTSRTKQATDKRQE